MSYLGLLTSRTPSVTPTPTPTPPAPPEPLRLMTLAQTVDAPVVPFEGTLAPIAGASLVTGGERITATDARLGRLGTPSADLTWRGEPYSYEFDYTGSALAFRFNCGAGASTKAFRVYVDGSPTTSGHVFPAESSQYRVALGAPKTRRIRLDLSFGMGFDGVDAEPGATVTAGPKKKRLYMLGDSWVEGTAVTAAGQSPGMDFMGFLTGRLLNADTWTSGIGGTGYSNGASGNRHYASTARLDRLVASQPDAVLVFGSINDNNSDGSGLGQYATALYSRLATDLPGVPVLVCGVQDWGQGFNGTDSSPEMTRAVAAAPNVKGYVQPLVEDWVAQGDNTINNAAYNNAHLTVKGNRYYAEKLAAFIARSLNIPAA